MLRRSCDGMEEVSTHVYCVTDDLDYFYTTYVSIPVTSLGLCIQLYIHFSAEVRAGQKGIHMFDKIFR